MFDLIAFDADDTLWHNENLYHESQTRFSEIMKEYCSPEIALSNLYKTEMRNLDYYGYGIKSFSLSMIETAVDLSHGGLRPDQVTQILALTRKMLSADVNLLDGVWDTISRLAQKYTLLIITKGDLIDQERKITRSGMSTFFQHIKIVSQKNSGSYSEILNSMNCTPERFLMIGNSLRSDILPVLELGGWAVYIPYPLSWEHENQIDKMIISNRFYELQDIKLLPDWVESKK